MRTVKQKAIAEENGNPESYSINIGQLYLRTIIALKKIMSHIQDKPPQPAT